MYMQLLPCAKQLTAQFSAGFLFVFSSLSALHILYVAVPKNSVALYHTGTLTGIVNRLLLVTVPVTETCRFWNRTTAVERRKRCSLLGVFLQRRVGCTTVQRTYRFYGR